MSRWDAASDSQRAAAAARAAAVALVRDAVRGGADERTAVEAAAKTAKATPAAVLRWLRRAPTADPADLIDRPRSGRPPEAWSGHGAEEAWKLWVDDYLTDERPAAAACWERVRVRAEKHGWTIPSIQAFVRRLRREHAPREIARARDGRLGALRTLPMQERTVEGMRPLEVVNGDGRMLDVFAKLPSGRVGRPHCWAWQDVRTRRILGWRLGEVESAELVRLALRDVCVEHGVPEAILLDNTRAASARWLVGETSKRAGDPDLPGILHLLGIGVMHTGVERTAAGRAAGRGWAKPIERAFSELAEWIDRGPMARGAYTGPSVDRKPESYGARVMGWDELHRAVAAGMATYNARPGRDMEAAAGRSIDEAWSEEIGMVAVRRLTRAQQGLLLRRGEMSRIGTDGTFRLAAARAPGVPAPRFYHEDLVGRRGRRLAMYYDPADLHGQVEVFDGPKWICTAECLARVGFKDTEAAARHNRSRRREQKALDQVERARAERADLTAYARDAAEADPPRPAPAAEAVTAMTPSRIETPAAIRRRLLRGLKRAAGDGE